MEIEPKPGASGLAVREGKRRLRTLASVFIVESVNFDDERAGRLEGDILSQILRLSGKATEYFYIRTKQELKAVLGEFAASNMRTCTFLATAIALLSSQRSTRFHSASLAASSGRI